MTDKREDDFHKHLLLVFRGEAAEHLKTISSGLLELEKKPDEQREKEIIELAYREAHSLKGASRAVSLTGIEAICQAVEGVLSSLKHRQIGISPEMFDTLHRAIDAISNLIASPKEEAADVTALLQQIDRIIVNGKKPEALPKEAGKEPLKMAEEHPSESFKASADIAKKAEQIARERSMPETVRVPVSRLDSLLLQAEEMLSVKVSVSQNVAYIREIGGRLTEWEREWAKFLSETKQRRNGSGASQVRLQEFFEWSRDYVKSLKSRLREVAKLSETSHGAVSGMVDNLIDGMKKTLMLQFSILLDVFPKLVRDLSRAQSKDVELVISGGEIEVDRQILEEMKDPLIHMIRNCIDHGIELPEARRQKGKPAKGKITIAISHADTNKVEILVSDDGSGIDLEKVRKAAREKGLLSEREAGEMSEHEAVSLIFRSEVSTSPIITDISGRGLGLAILHEKVEKLGGSITVNPGLHTGASFRIALPLTKATFRGIMVKAAEHLFVIPAANVERVTRVKRDEIRTVENRETIILDGRTVSFVRLSDILGLPFWEEKSEVLDFMQIAVLSAGEKTIAFGIDDVLEEQEILVKGLGKQLSRVRNISGAIVLGTDMVVPILNVSDLIKSGVKFTGAPAIAVGLKIEGKKKKSLLIAEDSITSRMLLKNILETAGYDIKTAVDGIDAFTALRTGEFDLVVSDIEMPRMDGFELTARIRSDKKLADIPVILVTGLESGEHREKGIDVGANAYIVKSSFDQSNLLEIIRRLI